MHYLSLTPSSAGPCQQILSPPPLVQIIRTARSPVTFPELNGDIGPPTYKTSSRPRVRPQATIASTERPEPGSAITWPRHTRPPRRSRDHRKRACVIFRSTAPIQKRRAAFVIAAGADVSHGVNCRRSTLTPDTWAEKFDPFTTEKFDAWNKLFFTHATHVKGWDQLFTIKLHESKFPFVSHIESIRSKLSSFSAHVSGVAAARRGRPPAVIPIQSNYWDRRERGRMVQWHRKTRSVAASLAFYYSRVFMWFRWRCAEADALANVGSKDLSDAFR